MIFAQVMAEIGSKESLISYFTKYTVVFIIFLIGTIISRMAGKIARKAISQLKFNELTIKKGTKIRLSTIVGTSLEFLGYFFTFLIAINELMPSEELPLFITIFIVLALAVSITLAIIGAKQTQKK